MKVLMFGWEFPPHILGGLGTASYGLTKGMSQQPDMDITFCIPKPWGDEDQSFLKIIGMNSVPIVTCVNIFMLISIICIQTIWVVWNSQDVILIICMRKLITILLLPVW